MISVGRTQIITNGTVLSEQQSPRSSRNNLDIAFIRTDKSEEKKIEGQMKDQCQAGGNIFGKLNEEVGVENLCDNSQETQNQKCLRFISMEMNASAEINSSKASTSPTNGIKMHNASLNETLDLPHNISFMSCEDEVEHTSNNLAIRKSQTQGEKNLQETPVFGSFTVGDIVMSNTPMAEDGQKNKLSARKLKSCKHDDIVKAAVKPILLSPIRRYSMKNSQTLQGISNLVQKQSCKDQETLVLSCYYDICHLHQDLQDQQEEQKREEQILDHTLDMDESLVEEFTKIINATQEAAGPICQTQDDVTDKIKSKIAVSTKIQDKQSSRKRTLYKISHQEKQNQLGRNKQIKLSNHKRTQSGVNIFSPVKDTAINQHKSHPEPNSAQLSKMTALKKESNPELDVLVSKSVVNRSGVSPKRVPKSETTNSKHSIINKMSRDEIKRIKDGLANFYNAEEMTSQQKTEKSPVKFARLSSYSPIKRLKNKNKVITARYSQNRQTTLQKEQEEAKNQSNIKNKSSAQIIANQQEAPPKTQAVLNNPQSKQKDKSPSKTKFKVSSLQLEKNIPLHHFSRSNLDSIQKMPTHSSNSEQYDIQEEDTTKARILQPCPIKVYVRFNNSTNKQFI